MQALAQLEAVDQRLRLRSLSSKRIVEVICEYRSHTLEDLRTRRRFPALVYSRDLMFFFLYTYTKMELKEIGEFFGGYDHTTVIHGRDKIQEELDLRTRTGSVVYEETVTDVHEILKMIKERSEANAAA